VAAYPAKTALQSAAELTRRGRGLRLPRVMWLIDQ
jgi:hypothetical protein